MWRRQGQLCRSSPCAAGAGASLALPQPWGHPGDILESCPCLGALLSPSPSSRREMPFASLAHHSGSPGGLAPAPRGSEHPSSADMGSRPAARDRGHSNIPSSPVKNRKRGLPCAVPRLSCPEDRNSLFCVWLCLWQLQILGRLSYISRERTNKNVGLL